MGSPVAWTTHLGNHSLDPFDQSPAEPAVGDGNGEPLLREVLVEESRWRQAGQQARPDSAHQPRLLLLSSCSRLRPCLYLLVPFPALPPQVKCSRPPEPWLWPWGSGSPPHLCLRPRLGLGDPWQQGEGQLVQQRAPWLWPLPWLWVPGLA